MGYKAYSDSYLMSLTKAQIVELLRIAEHNFFATEEALNNSAKAGMEIAEKYDKAKELLKLAICELGDAQDCDSCIADCSIGTDCIYKWHCSNEAEKLING